MNSDKTIQALEEEPTTLGGAVAEISVQNLQKHCKASTYTQYSSVLNRLMSMFEGKTWKWVLTHPKKVMQRLNKEKTITKPSSYANYAAAIRTMIRVHEDVLPQEERKYEEWKTLLTEKRAEQEKDYMSGHVADEKLSKVVTWEEMTSKVAELKADPRTHDTERSHLQYVLLSTLVMLPPKRADYGKVKIVMKLPRDHLEHNYILMGKSPVLVINNHKTDQTYGAIREQLSPEFVEMLRDSLRRYPREYLLVSPRGGPYEKNNTFTKHMIRTCDEVFGRGMGVSLWRHVFSTERVDLNDDLAINEKIAKSMGTSVRRQMEVYKFSRESKAKIRELHHGDSVGEGSAPVNKNSL